MTPRFCVRTSREFERLARRLTDQHPQDFPRRYAEAITVLETDPHNVNRRHSIRKLSGVRPGDGQAR